LVVGPTEPGLFHLASGRYEAASPLGKSVVSALTAHRDLLPIKIRMLAIR
jgi:hypothetical protein